MIAATTFDSCTIRACRGRQGSPKGVHPPHVGQSSHRKLRGKKVLTGLLIVIAAVVGAAVFERVAHHGSFGPAAMMALSIVGVVSLILLLMLLLHETRYRETIARVWQVVISISIT